MQELELKLSETLDSKNIYCCLQYGFIAVFDFDTVEPSIKKAQQYLNDIVFEGVTFFNPEEFCDCMNKYDWRSIDITYDEEEVTLKINLDDPYYGSPSMHFTRVQPLLNTKAINDQIDRYEKIKKYYNVI